MNLRKKNSEFQIHHLYTTSSIPSFYSISITLNRSKTPISNPDFAIFGGPFFTIDAQRLNVKVKLKRNKKEGENISTGESEHGP